MIGNAKTRDGKEMYLLVMSKEETEIMMEFMMFISGNPDGPRGVAEKFLVTARDCGFIHNAGFYVEGTLKAEELPPDVDAPEDPYRERPHPNTADPLRPLTRSERNIRPTPRVDPLRRSGDEIGVDPLVETGRPVFPVVPVDTQSREDVPSTEETTRR